MAERDLTPEEENLIEANAERDATDEEIADIELAARAPQNVTPVPDETSVSSTPYLPAKPPSAYDKARIAAKVFGVDPHGLIPSEEDLRGAIAALTQGPARGWADELAGVLAENQQEQRNWVTPRSKRIDPRWAGRHAKEEFRRIEKQFREDNPMLGLGLTATGGVLAGGPRLGRAAGLTRYLPAAVEGAVSGAGGAETMEDIPRMSAIGAPLGVAGQVAGELAGEAAGTAGRFLTGWYQPSAAAQYLRSRGVNDLTLGQMVPDSWAAQAEEAGTSVAGVGPAIRAQRDAGRASWQQAVMAEAVPPGGTPPNPTLPISERLAQSYDDFSRAYAPARGQPVVPQGIDLLPDAADNPNVLATDQQREAVRRFLANQTTLLRVDPQTGEVPSDQLLSVRTAIREAIRDSDDGPTRQMLQTAADNVTNLLDAQLPPQAANALRAADARYGGYKVVEDAVRRAGDQTAGFSPAQLSSAVRAATPGPAYARGAGGELRALAQAGRETLDMQVPNTGSRLLAAGPVPYVTGPMSYAANLPGPRDFLTGQLPWQQSDWLQDLAQTNPEILGRWGQYLGSAAAQSSEALGSANRDLQETDPEYQAAMRRNGGQQP